jgi:Protein of unknown function (DUF1573)
MQNARAISVLALSLLAFAPAAAYAQFGPMEADVQSSIEVYAELTLEQTIVDLGTMSDEEPKTVKIGFRNTGTGMLNIIGDPKGSCGCTVPQLLKKDYKPGEGGVIEVTYNPSGKRDAQQTTVTITSNDRAKPNATINIKSNVRPNVMWDPQVATFHQIAKGKGGKTIITVTSRLPDFSISEITSTLPDIIEAKVIDSKTQAGADGVPTIVSQVEVTLKPTTPVGSHNPTLTLRTTNAKRQYISLSAFAEINGDLSATPIQFFLNQVHAGQDLASVPSSKVVVRHREGKPFRITKAEVVKMMNGVDHTFTVDAKPEDESGSTWAITLMGVAPAPSTPNAVSLMGDVVLTTDIPDETTMKIRYNGMVAPAPSQAFPAAPSAQFKMDPRGGDGAQLNLPKTPSLPPTIK